MIFSKKLIKGKNGKEKEVEFDLFQNFVDSKNAESKQSLNKAALTYNFCLTDGELKGGYGFKQLSMPTSSSNVENEEIVEFDGQKVYSIWSFKWYDNTIEDNKYYLVLYNDNSRLGFINLFSTRPIKLFIPNTFTEQPIGCNTRYNGDDAMIFSSSGNDVCMLTGTSTRMLADAPKIVSICWQFDKYFAIPKNDRKKLIYSDKNITEWTTSNVQNLMLDDNKGKLNKVMAFNDYVYVFRDFGISKISVYSTKNLFDISGVYECDSVIYPGTIASSGDKIYFLEGSGIYSFNGSQTSKINLDCDEMLNKTKKQNASAVCFEGKYYLACRYDFDDGLAVGCESQEGYGNNVLFVIDIMGKNVNLLRGVDIRGLCVLNNPFKSKIVACFNGANDCYIGELTKDGEIFSQASLKEWQSVNCDLGYPDKMKKAEYFTIKSKSDCVVTIQSDKESKVYSIVGSGKIQRIKTSVFGKEFKVSLKTDDKSPNISNLKMGFKIF